MSVFAPRMQLIFRTQEANSYKKLLNSLTAVPLSAKLEQ